MTGSMYRRNKLIYAVPNSHATRVSPPRTYRHMYGGPRVASPQGEKREKREASAICSPMSQTGLDRRQAKPCEKYIRIPEKTFSTPSHPIRVSAKTPVVARALRFSYIFVILLCSRLHRPRSWASTVFSRMQQTADDGPGCMLSLAKPRGRISSSHQRGFLTSRHRRDGLPWGNEVDSPGALIIVDIEASPRVPSCLSPHGPEFQNGSAKSLDSRLRIFIPAHARICPLRTLILDITIAKVDSNAPPPTPTVPSTGL